MSLVLVMFGTSESGLWNMKRYGFFDVDDAIECGDTTECDGYVILETSYAEGVNADEVKVVYEYNTDDVRVSVFPFIGVYSKEVAEV